MHMVDGLALPPGTTAAPGLGTKLWRFRQRRKAYRQLIDGLLMQSLARAIDPSDYEGGRAVNGAKIVREVLSRTPVPGEPHAGFLTNKVARPIRRKVMGRFPDVRRTDCAPFDERFRKWVEAALEATPDREMVFDGDPTEFSQLTLQAFYKRLDAVNFDDKVHRMLGELRDSLGLGRLGQQTPASTTPIASRGEGIVGGLVTSGATAAVLEGAIDPADTTTLAVALGIGTLTYVGSQVQRRPALTRPQLQLRLEVLKWVASIVGSKAVSVNHPDLSSVVAVLGYWQGRLESDVVRADLDLSIHVDRSRLERFSDQAAHVDDQGLHAALIELEGAIVTGADRDVVRSLSMVVHSLKY